MKSEVLSAAKIEIPFPKREVFVHFPDEKPELHRSSSEDQGAETEELGERETDDTEKK